jgi:hypothetical protein
VEICGGLPTRRYGARESFAIPLKICTLGLFRPGRDNLTIGRRFNAGALAHGH